MRLFIGIKLDENALKKVNNYYKYLYSNGVTGNFTSIANLHLTLAFLGEVALDKSKEIAMIIDGLQNSIESFEIIRLTKLKDILVGEVLRSPELLELHRELRDKLKQKGFTISDKEFYPHITLIREVKNLEGLKIIDSNIEITSKVSKITLFESIRIKGNLQYIPLN